MIERSEIMTNSDLINWLEVLGKGYTKPDIFADNNNNNTGVVKDTAHYLPFIMSINKTLCERSGMDCPDVDQFLQFREEKQKRPRI